MRIKICGLTRSPDAVLAHSLGATELGFIFCESDRQISLSRAKSISSVLPQAARTVGVFKDPSMGEILSAVKSVPLAAVQLHGSESPEFISELKKRKPKLTVIKAILELDQDYHVDPTLFSHCDFLLYDSFSKGSLTTEVTTTTPFYLAGALGSHNVLSLISAYRPVGIDLCRSVESSPGIKDSVLLRNFFATMKGQL